MSSTPPVITRFAPSPTGHLHVGGARTALFCWAFAKKNHGHFLLRIEDTDAARSSDESARGIMEDLAWLGINWDEGPELVPRPSGTGVSMPVPEGRRTKIGGDPRGVGPFFQAQRLSTYDAHIMRLVEKGRAYPAFEDDATLNAEKKSAELAKRNYRYNRASYEKVRDVKDRIRIIEKGEPHVIRFFAADEEIAFTDQVLGDVRIAPGELDDFIIRRNDGFPMYNFAVVVDDHAMGITHVLRAQEHLSNTPRQIALYRAFGFASPSFGHMPLIFNLDDGKKMSKRDKAKAARKALKDRLAKSGETKASDETAMKMGLSHKELNEFLVADNDSLPIAEAIAKHYNIGLPEIEVADFREAGYTPEAINNFLALLGWNPGMKLPDGKDLEKFDMDFLSKNFSIERIGKTNSKFDRVKLMSFNADALGAMSDEEFAKRWFAWCEEFSPALAQKAKQWGGSGDSSGDGSPATSARWLWLAKAVKPRAKTLKDAIKACGFLMLDHVTIDPAIAAKHLDANNAEGRSLLKTYCERLSSLAAFEPKPIHDEIEKLAKEKGFANPGPIAQAVRVAVAGVPVTPGIGETLAVLGKAEALKRLSACAS